MKTLRVLGFFAAFTFASTPVLAEPAFWVSKSASATVYLFGPIHVLAAGAAWDVP
jgi:uncharacterized protein YbaP (TraB family)